MARSISCPAGASHHDRMARIRAAISGRVRRRPRPTRNALLRYWQSRTRRRHRGPRLAEGVRRCVDDLGGVGELFGSEGGVARPDAR